MGRLFIEAKGSRYAPLLVICTLSCPSLSHAETAWSLNPSVRMEGSYDDNASLNATTPNEVTARRLSAEIGVMRSQPDGEFQGLFGVDLIDYGDSDVVRTDNNQFLKMGVVHRARRSTWGIDAALQRDSLLRTVELPPDTGPDGPIGNTDIALITIPVRRERMELRPKWTYDLTRRNALKVSYALSVEHFEETEATNIVDYNNHALKAGLSHRLSPATLVTASVRANRLQPDKRERVDTYELLAELKHRYSPIGTVGVEVGTRRVMRESNRNGDDTGLVAGLSWSGKGPLSTSLLKLERRLYPNGFGDLVETDQIIANWSRRLGRTTRLFMRGRAFMTDSLFPGSRDGREYAQLNGEIRHSFERWWDIGIMYRYRGITRDTDPERAESSAIFISIGYDKALALN